MEKITYLIANYNQAKYITACINSLQKQTNPNWIALIYDDASQDNSVAIIKKLLAPNIKLYQSQANKGKIYALEYLINKAETQFLTILDPDDCLLPEANATTLQFYQSKHQAQWAYSCYQEMDENLTKTTRICGSAPAKGQSLLISGMVGLILTFPIALYQKTGGFNRKMLYAEDKDLIYKLEEQAVGAFIPQVLYLYRNIKSSATHDKKKRNLGAKHHFLIQKEALQRRKISGFKKQLYLILFWLISQWYPYNKPFLFRAFFWICFKVLRFLFQPLLKNKQEFIIKL